MKEKKTVVIFGASSFIGSNLCAYLRKDFRVIGTYHRNKYFCPGVLTIPCDVLAKEEVRLVMLAFKPDVAIYCVGNSNINYCSENEEVADALNTGGLVNVIDFSQRHKTQVCFISSAHVFSGDKENYTEIDIPDPSTTYGKTMASSEFFLQRNCLNYLIIRCCKIYGRSFNPEKPSWFDFMQQIFFERKTFSFDNRIKLGFLDVNFLAYSLKEILKKNPNNRMFQLSSQDSATFHEFAKMYANIFNDEKTAISSGKMKFPLIKDLTTNFEKGIDQVYSLDTSNIESYLNIMNPTIEDSLNFSFKNYGGISSVK